MPRIAKNQQQSKPREKKSRKSEWSPKYAKPHVIIPVEDLGWAIEQNPALYQLWGECWRSDPFGSRWVQLTTKLKRSAFMQSKKILESEDLFIFKPDKSIRDGRETVCWLVRNLHGSRVREFWEPKLESTAMDSNSTAMDSNSESTLTDSNSTTVDVLATDVEVKSIAMDSIDGEIKTEQSFQEASVTSQEHLSNSSKELLRCCPDKSNLATAPTGGALPELTKTEIFDLLDAAAQGVCPSSGAIACLLETEYAHSLLKSISNHPEWGVEVSSFIPQTVQVKERSQLRQGRADRLKAIASVEEQPDIAFLRECWDDPALRIQIKKMLKIRTEWGIECGDEGLNYQRS